ncbi:DoxX family protein OS=Tsukamurella paurometabola (strain ATCC 8368 / DSM / CCUG 35730 / CIP 100753 / JCM 10117 / KCTC 9821 / NBRC 16120 / NCIMB 702349/ NCTC 13040) OX=521096 GN=Tpau_1342 PE=3 SV=1 [Tsukamurella paurometabola]|uniref:DoxX family protein n=1 Tax=Tsukamurella paurometabola (strain ATCC 8368 / DSM 20162 / CCUG 35730 / CIP 100753 / JCM 10117 / KCTC 9821 / NBRC 16120 / NCIMB 702349 / NCTC 13040) TaxID=521096 RepID=D5UWU9_TSUPD|nr:DoxX family protein [Tsukamurella paurometabola]ADG77971.1 DoxX family protein [Tsukamurella paurometabola DSM 20162]SUP29580.1 DoxX [Tsukamurella paurometabola]
MNRWALYYLSALRIVIGVLFALHGAATYWGFLDGPQSSPGVFAWPSWWGALIQLVGGLLIAFGAATRPAAIITSGSMAFAYFAYHAGDGLSPLANNGELSVLYCWILLLFAFTGPGPISLDALIGRGRNDGQAPATEKDAAESAV